MENRNIKVIARAISIVGSAILVVYILFMNFPPYGNKYTLNGKQLSGFSPTTRIKHVQITTGTITMQLGDLIYFTTEARGYDKAQIKFIFLNSNPEQEIHLGYRDKPTWDYFTKPAYLPLIENLDWKRVNASSPTLYQRYGKYTSISEFLKSPPSEAVGTYYFPDTNLIENKIPNYQPTGKWAKINTPLRGSHTFYAYIQNQPFYLSITKQDLNWYQGADPLNIKVYKDNNLLTQRTIPDDGITDESKIPGKIQQQIVQYNEGFPADGVYKIVLSGNGDTVIKSIDSNFDKLVFRGPIFPIGESSMYDKQLSGKAKDVLYTNSNNINFETYHPPSLQNIYVNSDVIPVSTTEAEINYKINNNRNIITIPKGDVIVNGDGYFAFSPSQFFDPYIFKDVSIINKGNLSGVNFLLTDYQKVFNLDGGWKEADLEFDLNKSYFNKNTLSWIVKAPGLQENGNKILIKDIEVTLIKDPIIKP